MLFCQKKSDISFKILSSPDRTPELCSYCLIHKVVALTIMEYFTTCFQGHNGHTYEDMTWVHSWQEFIESWFSELKQSQRWTSYIAFKT